MLSSSTVGSSSIAGGGVARAPHLWPAGEVDALRGPVVIGGRAGGGGGGGGGTEEGGVGAVGERDSTLAPHALDRERYQERVDVDENEVTTVYA